MAVDRTGAERAIESFLRALGRDPSSEPQLRGTAARVTAAFADELCEGYEVDPDGVVSPHLVESLTGSTAVVALHNVPVTTMCPHHLLPASGLGTVAFAPREKLVGLGVLARLLDVYAHRLILQEEVGERVAETLARGLGARWVACRLVLSHACVTARGERKHGATVETVAFVGDAEDRAEAMAIVKGEP